MTEPASTDLSNPPPPAFGTVAPGAPTAAAPGTQQVVGQQVLDFNLGNIFKAFISFAADKEAGKKVDTVLEIWKETARADAKNQFFAQAVRLSLSIGVLASLVILAWNKTISGEAVTAILGAFVGYLWGEKHAKKESSE